MGTVETMGLDEVNKLMARLESLGELEVRRQLPSGLYGFPDTDMRIRVEDWLRAQEAAREAEAVSIAREANSIAQSADSTAKEALSTAKEALRTARQERNTAYTAAIAAIIAVVMTAIQWFSKP